MPEEQLSQSSPHMYYAPPAISTIPNLLQQTNPDTIIELLEHQVKNEVWDEDNKKWVAKDRPLLNDKGVNVLIMAFRGIINHNTILSNLSDKDIESLMKGLIDQIIVLIYTRWKEFGIDKSNLTPIADLFCNTAYLALKRAYDNGERDFYTKSIQESRVMAQRPTQQREEKKFTFGSFFKH